MDLTSLIQKTDLSYATVLQAINRGSDKEADSLSPIYEKYVKSILNYEPASLSELEQKTRFILHSLLGDHEDPRQAKLYTEIILNDVQRLISA